MNRVWSRRGLASCDYKGHHYLKCMDTSTQINIDELVVRLGKKTTNLFAMSKYPSTSDGRSFTLARSPMPTLPKRAVPPAVEFFKLLSTSRSS